MAGIFCECSILIRLGQDLHLVAGGSTSSYSHCLKCQDAIQTVKCEFESNSGEGIEGLTAKFFGGDVDLVRTNWLFPENCETILQTQPPLLSPMTHVMCRKSPIFHIW
jgi:hypothetical protein